MIEYRNIPDLIEAFKALPDERLQRTLSWTEVGEIASIHAVDLTNAPHHRARIKRLRQRFLGRICNCPMPEGLRWDKVNRGEPISFSFDLTKAPQTSFSWETAIKSAMAIYWAKSDNGFPIRFVQTRTKGDIHVSFDEIDEQGGTLGMAFMPSAGYEMDVADWSGDIVIDMHEVWSWGLAVTTLGHEFGHALGISHINVYAALMYAIMHSNRFELHRSDERERNMRYPQQLVPLEPPLNALVTPPLSAATANHLLGR